MKGLTDGQKVWVSQSGCGYQGPAILVGLAFGSKWLVKAPDDRVFTVDAVHLKPVEEEPVPQFLSKEEKKELRRKLKLERKNHRPSGGSSRR